MVLNKSLVDRTISGAIHLGSVLYEESNRQGLSVNKGMSLFSYHRPIPTRSTASISAWRYCGSLQNMTWSELSCRIKGGQPGEHSNFVGVQQNDVSQPEIFNNENINCFRRSLERKPKPFSPRIYPTDAIFYACLQKAIWYSHSQIFPDMHIVSSINKCDPRDLGMACHTKPEKHMICKCKECAT